MQKLLMYMCTMKRTLERSNAYLAFVYLARRHHTAKPQLVAKVQLVHVLRAIGPCGIRSFNQKRRLRTQLLFQRMAF